MSAQTSRLGLTMPGGGSHGNITPGEIVDIDVINDNMRLLDSVAGAGQYSSTTHPATPFPGQIVKESDTGALVQYNGTAWEVIGYASTAQGSVVQATKSAAQTVTTTESGVFFDVNTFLTGTGITHPATGNNTPFTANIAGLYRITAKAAIGSGTVGLTMKIKKVTGAVEIPFFTTDGAAQSTAFTKVEATGLVQLVAGDQVAMYITAIGGSAALNNAQTVFQMEYVRPSF